MDEVEAQKPIGRVLAVDAGAVLQVVLVREALDADFCAEALQAEFLAAWDAPPFFRVVAVVALLEALLRERGRDKIKISVSRLPDFRGREGTLGRFYTDSTPDQNKSHRFYDNARRSQINLGAGEDKSSGTNRMR